jgi:hypothetical protein
MEEEEVNKINRDIPLSNSVPGLEGQLSSVGKVAISYFYTKA